MSQLEDPQDSVKYVVIMFDLSVQFAPAALRSSMNPYEVKYCDEKNPSVASKVAKFYLPKDIQQKENTASKSEDRIWDGIDNSSLWKGRENIKY